MGLPSVNISRGSGLNRVATTEDNVFCLLLSGTAVSGKIQLSDPRLIHSVDDLTTLGITSGNNALAYSEVVAFYQHADAGTDLYIMLYSNTTMLASICDKDTGIVRTLLDFTEGRANGLFVHKIMPNGYTPVITTGLDADVLAAVTKLQALCELYETKNQPLFAVIPAFGFTVGTANTLLDLNTLTDNQVTILNAADNSSGKAAIGATAGWLAKVESVKGSAPINKYWQNAGRVADGPFADSGWFVDGTPANDKSVQNILDAMNDKRYMFLRKFVGKSGFFFNDDPTACSVTDDFSSISWNRVINKAQRITYSVLVEKLNDDVEANPLTGGMSISLAADWESDVENAINSQMTKVGAITACKCIVDTDNSNLTNDEVDATTEIVRQGQAKQINMTIEYTSTL